MLYGKMDISCGEEVQNTPIHELNLALRLALQLCFVAGVIFRGKHVEISPVTF